MYAERLVLYKKLEKCFKSKVLIYFTSDRPNMEAQIASDVINYFIQQLDKIGTCKKITLFLYTRGGDTAAAWNIINLLRMYCDKLQVIVPHKAHSAGTIISLGANEIVMTKQATLGPIDPSINTPLNPVAPNGLTYPVSVEAVKGYLEFAKNELGIREDIALAKIFGELSEKVHPLVLGQVYRSKAQIQMLAEKLLVHQVTNSKKIRKIISFLCSESGSHDYTINRREAKKSLDLKIVKPTEEQYMLIKDIYDNISEELLLNKIFDPREIQGVYVCRRCLLESVRGGSDYFVTEGNIGYSSGPNGEPLLQNRVTFEGWRHDFDVDSSVKNFNEKKEGIKYERSKKFQL